MQNRGCKMETHQGQLDFEASGKEAGYVKWMTGQRMAAEELARRLGLPLGHQVEVWLVGAIRLRGKLRLQDSVLFVDEDRERHLELAVDRVRFTLREMESCSRLD